MRKSARLEKKLVAKKDGGSKKRIQRDSDNEGDSGEKKKRPRYPRAPSGSLANPDWD